MPQTATKIPATIRRSEKHAQQIWKKAHESAVKTYGDTPAAHRVAYGALKHQYEKASGGRWVKKARKGPSDPQSARSVMTTPKSTDEPRAPSAGGKVARTPREALKKAKQARREYGQWRRGQIKKKGRLAA